MEPVTSLCWVKGESVPGEVTSKLRAEGCVGLTTRGLGEEQLFSGEGTAYAETLRKEKGAKREAQVVAGAWRGGKGGLVGGARMGHTGPVKDRVPRSLPSVEFFIIIINSFLLRTVLDLPKN